MQVCRREYFYTIFSTDWGYFGLAGTAKGISRAFLPQNNIESVRKTIMAELPGAVENPLAFLAAQKAVKGYYSGSCSDFSAVGLDLEGFTPFTRAVLAACAKISSGKILNYSELAAKAGKPDAVRAAASALARNPIPLLIPCHRVIRRDGGMGGFSAPGGIAVKKRMLEHEKKS
jgi:methylated-DNA-[protein]-cysteine S-methyltransferase